VNKPPVIAPSGAEVIQFPASGKSFTADAKRWWKMAMGHPNLGLADRIFCSAIYDGFNTGIYKQTGGQLVAWPSWDKISAEFGLGKTAIFESQKRVESLGLLAVDHGRYDHTTKRREHNTYRAILRPAVNVQGSHGEPRQGSHGEPREGSDQGSEQGSPFEQDSSSLTRRDESYKSCKREISEYSESSDSAKTSDSANRTPERALRPEAEKEQASTTPEFKRLMAPIVARNRVATNGSGDL